MGRAARQRIATLVAVGALCAAVAPTVAAQELGPGDGSSTTSTAPPSSTSTTTTTPKGSTTTTTTPSTTVPYVPPLPPELQADPRVPFLVDPGPEDGIDVPIAQLPFDLQSIQVLPERVEAAREVLSTAQLALRSVQEELGALGDRVSELHARVEGLRGEVRGAVEAAAAARRALADHAVTAYMVGPVEDQMALLRSADAVDMGVARSYLGVVADRREQLVRDYEEKRAGLSSDHARLAAQLGEDESQLAALSGQLPGAFQAVVSATEELAAYEAGAHAYVEGFVFPVAGDSEFIDSWGYPRMMGTASAHWHQGSDIFAPAGTPLIASENGALQRIGTASLGGNKLWIVGESGNHYYYAHLSAFAEGIAEGQEVRAGEIVGYVGDTGNARGTSPHLHFEIHPDGRGPVNPYPLLKAAYGSRPAYRAVAPTTTLVPPVGP